MANVDAVLLWGRLPGLPVMVMLDEFAYFPNMSQCMLCPTGPATATCHLPLATCH